MKLPIKKKYFDLIKSGEKVFEWRDAHITFICEETGRTIRKEVNHVLIVDKKAYEDWDIPEMSKREWEEMFEDEKVMGFALK